MSSDFHALAIDYDGTLTTEPRPSDDALAAVRAVRDAGRTCILVTGRILAELRRDFPDVEAHFDAIVGENGGVLARPGEAAELLADPVPAELELALLARRVPVRRGQVLLATDVTFDGVVNEEIRRLGLECQLVRNRNALMVLPSGVTKGTGTVAALDAFNLSAHNTVAIGDAENDHTLLEACELGVAVENAIGPLKVHADVTLEQPDGAGIAAFLRGPFLAGLPGTQPRRRRIILGTYDDGTSATLPASRINIAIEGVSGCGKSHFAGLVAEQLIHMNYAVCVLDLEGDHVALGELHGVVALGGRNHLPAPEDVASLLSHGMGSVVVDLSLEGEDQKRSYAQALLGALHRTREHTGIPHWIFVDEAHVPLRTGAEGGWCSDDITTGLCVITYNPELLCRHVRARTAARVTLDREGRLSLECDGAEGPRPFTAVERRIGHVRHWHKYTEGRLPAHRQFYFREGDQLTGRTAGNVPELAVEIRRASPGTLRHHAAHADFSRWLGDLGRAPELTAAIRSIEVALTAARSDDEIAQSRLRLVDTVRAEFQIDPSKVPSPTARGEKPWAGCPTLPDKR